MTGASSGIGREMCRQLCRDGVVVTAVARDVGRLEVLRAELEDAPGQVEVLGADLAVPEELERVEARVLSEARPVDLLVNNAGFGTYGRFSELPVDEEVREVQVNVVAVMRLAHAALCAMGRRGKGAVCNISSVAGLQATPGNATYGATKAFVTSFSEALHEETRGTGVTVTAVLPGFTRTEFQERAGIEGRKIPGIAWQEADEVARQALAATAAGKALFVPGTLNKVVAAGLGPVPRGVRRRVAARATSRL